MSAVYRDERTQPPPRPWRDPRLAGGGHQPCGRPFLALEHGGSPKIVIKGFRLAERLTEMSPAASSALSPTYFACGVIPQCPHSTLVSLKVWPRIPRRYRRT